MKTAAIKISNSFRLVHVQIALLILLVFGTLKAQQRDVQRLVAENGIGGSYSYSSTSYGKFLTPANDDLGKLQHTLENLWTNLGEPVANATETYNAILTNAVYTPMQQQQRHNHTKEITLLTHTGTSKLDNLWRQIRWWNGPSCVGMYLKSLQDIEAFVAFLEAHKEDLFPSSSSSMAKYPTTFHVMLEKTLLGYPHNILRNLVMDHSETDYFLAMDVDFVTSPNAHDGLLGLLQSDPAIIERLHHRWLFVLPAFELLQIKHPHNNSFLTHSDGTRVSPTEDMLPRTKEEVLARKQNNTLLIFHIQQGKAHRPTRFDLWEKKDLEATFYTVEYEGTFEPYVLGYRKGVPRLWTEFRGFGFNKVSWFTELHRAGYQFASLRDFWVVHMNHPVSKAVKKEFSERNRPYLGSFMKYLKDHYAPVQKEKATSIPPWVKRNNNKNKK